MISANIIRKHNKNNKRIFIYSLKLHCSTINNLIKTHIVRVFLCESFMKMNNYENENK